MPEVTKRRSIFDISDDMHALDDLLFENGGDVSDPAVEAAVHKWMEELDQDLERKADNYAAFILEVEKRAEVRRQEADRLMARSKADESQAAWLRAMLKSVFESRGIKKLETARFRLGVQGNGGKQPLDIFGLVPDEFMVAVPQVNREAIRAALEEGRQLEFARLMERGTRLAIR